MNPRLANVAIATVTFLIAAIAFAPALGASFHFEDFSYLALMRHVGSPWALVSGNAFFAYYYRATGLLFWWLSTQLVGYDPWWHNLIDLLLYSTNAALLGLFATRLTGERMAGLIVGISFACLPAAASTAMWMSDRYDLLALLFGLLALLTFENALAGSRRAIFWTALWLFLAITSKEIAYAIAASMIVLVGWQMWSARKWNRLVIMAVLAPVLGALLLRVLTVESLESALDLHNLSAAMSSGIVAWWQRLPIALFGFREPAVWLYLLAAAIVVTGVIVIVCAARAERREVMRLSLIGAMLVVVPSIIQWPVTSLVLPNDVALAYTVNLRFYHLAAAGIALLLGATWLALRTQGARVAFTAGMLVLCSTWLACARENARDWSRNPITQTSNLLRFGTELGVRTFPSHCRISIRPDNIPDYMRSHIDSIVKASTAPDSSILGCTVSAETVPFLTLLDRNDCNAAAWPGLPIKQLGGRPAIELHDRSCFVIFTALESGDTHPARFDFRMDADGHAVALDPAATSVAHDGQR